MRAYLMLTSPTSIIHWWILWHKNQTYHSHVFHLVYEKLRLSNLENKLKIGSQENKLFYILKLLFRIFNSFNQAFKLSSKTRLFYLTLSLAESKLLNYLFFTKVILKSFFLIYNDQCLINDMSLMTASRKLPPKSRSN